MAKQVIVVFVIGVTDCEQALIAHILLTISTPSTFSIAHVILCIK
ncbi:hypothetical protein [Peribacillus muralis]|nr:hypothetical protein [Peribacillus muralis]